MKRIFPGFPIRHPRLVLTIIGLITVVAALQLPKIRIDTDPENMLPADEPVRVIHKNVEAAFNLNDFLVLGVVVDEGTVFTPAILQRVQKITDAVRDMDGVIADDILAPSEVDDILPDEGGGIRVQTLMEERSRQRRGRAADPGPDQREPHPARQARLRRRQGHRPLHPAREQGRGHGGGGADPVRHRAGPR